MKKKRVSARRLVELCDAVAEVRASCVFLLSAYDAMSREPGEIDADISSGGAVLARDLKRKVMEIERLLEQMCK